MSIPITTARLGVLNTRPHAQAAELSWLLAQAGYEPIEAPAIEVVPAWNPVELENVRRNLLAGAFQWVVLPSQNAGLMLADVLDRASVVCGSQTARALGLQPEHRLDRFSAAVALNVLGHSLVPGQRVLLPRGAGGRDELTDGLDELGAVVYSPVAYRTVAVDASTLRDAERRLHAGEVHAIAVCSPSAVESLLAAIDRHVLDSVPLVCLGATTAEAASRAGLNVAGVGEKTTMASLVSAIAAVLAARDYPPSAELAGEHEVPA